MSNKISISFRRGDEDAYAWLMQRKETMSASAYLVSLVKKDMDGRDTNGSLEARVAALERLLQGLDLSATVASKEQGSRGNEGLSESDKDLLNSLF